LASSSHPPFSKTQIMNLAAATLRNCGINPIVSSLPGIVTMHVGSSGSTSLTSPVLRARFFPRDVIPLRLFSCPCFLRFSPYDLCPLKVPHGVQPVRVRGARLLPPFFPFMIVNCPLGRRSFTAGTDDSKTWLLLIGSKPSVWPGILRSAPCHLSLLMSPRVLQN